MISHYKTRSVSLILFSVERKASGWGRRKLGLVSEGCETGGHGRLDITCFWNLLEVGASIEGI